MPASHALLCKDLSAHRYTFAEANRYWVREGRPGRMDADLNGIPCQTVYSLAQVQTIYPEAEAPVAQVPSATVAGGGATAQCRDGSLSYSQHRSGTCSHHHGVAMWF